jgi:hypothetical protein
MRLLRRWLCNADVGNAEVQALLKEVAKQGQQHAAGLVLAVCRGAVPHWVMAV